MPVYLFTYHAYQSWMPDHRRGYTRRGKGYQPADPEKARQYRESATSKPVEFDRDTQRSLIEELLTACRFQKLRCHAGSTEPSHIHGLVSWQGFRPWERVRASLKSSLSRRLSRMNDEFEELVESLDVSKPLDSIPDSRDATRRRSSEEERGRFVLKLSRGGSRKRVRDKCHFDYLMQTYLAKHKGVKWFEDRGWVD